MSWGFYLIDEVRVATKIFVLSLQKIRYINLPYIMSSYDTSAESRQHFTDYSKREVNE